MQSMFSKSVRHLRTRSFSSLKSSYENIIVTKKGEHDCVGFITLNRPKALNALCSPLISELNHATQALDKDSSVGAIVITGSEKAFAAGADISEMSKKTMVEAIKTNMFADWGDLRKISKPTIAAVNGFALGGGCELAMLCDIIVAGDKARFGQPEIKLGTIPGCGGTQRLVRSVGKSKAMAMILVGDPITAQEAEACGLVAKVVPAAELVDYAISMGVKISQFSKPVVSLAKEAVNAAYETTLDQGILLERRAFHSTFGTADQKEGMAAFLEKRKANFKDE